MCVLGSLAWEFTNCYTPIWVSSYCTYWVCSYTNPFLGLHLPLSTLPSLSPSLSPHFSLSLSPFPSPFFLFPPPFRLKDLTAYNMERTITILGTIDNCKKAESLISAKLRASYESDMAQFIPVSVSHMLKDVAK